MNPLPIAIIFALCWSLAIAAGSHAEMAIVAAGPFTMGSNDGPDDERPAHVIHVAAFAIDRLPVTNEQFAEFLNAAGTQNARGERLYDYDDSDARIHIVDGR